MSCLAMGLYLTCLMARTGLFCAHALNGKGNAPHNRNTLPCKHAVFFEKFPSKKVFQKPLRVSLFYRNLNAGSLEACIHKQHVTRYPGGQVGSKEQGSVAHFFNGYVLFQGGVMFNVV